jgi:hypothetical protein
MDFYVTPNVQMVECIINPSGGLTQQKNPFGTQQQLQNRKVIAIETFSNQDMANSPITTANPVIPQAVFLASFLTMYTAAIPAMQGHPKQAEGLYFDQLPLCMFRRVFNANTTPGSVTSGGNTLFRIRPTEMSWTKCYVSIPNATALSQACSMILLVHYLDINDPGTEYN